MEKAEVLHIGFACVFLGLRSFLLCVIFTGDPPRRQPEAGGTLLGAGLLWAPCMYMIPSKAEKKVSLCGRRWSVLSVDCECVTQSMPWLSPWQTRQKATCVHLRMCLILFLTVLKNFKLHRICRWHSRTALSEVGSHMTGRTGLTVTPELITRPSFSLCSSIGVYQEC